MALILGFTALVLLFVLAFWYGGGYAKWWPEPQSFTRR